MSPSRGPGPAEVMCVLWAGPIEGRAGGAFEGGEVGLRLSSGKGLSGLLIVPLEASMARRGVSATFGGVGCREGVVFGGSLAQSVAGSPV